MFMSVGRFMRTKYVLQNGEICLAILGTIIFHNKHCKGSRYNMVVVLRWCSYYAGSRCILQDYVLL